MTERSDLRSPPHPDPLPEGEGISIIMPMRNAAAWVKESIQSVLRQHDVNIEIIVVDDGSTDASVAVVKSLNDPRIHIIPGPQRGIAAAFNAGLSAATGDFIARCDSDDLYPPDRLAWQLEFLRGHWDFAAVCGHFATIDETGELISDHYEEFPAGEITDEIKSGRSRSHMCAYLFRAEILRKLGGCREWFATSEDADLQYRLSEAGKIWFEPKRAYEYRLHSDSITHQQKSAERKFFEKMAREFQLQRQQKGADELQCGHPPTVELDRTAQPRHAIDQIQEILLSKAWREHKTGAKSSARKTGWRAVKRKPSHLGAWKSWLALWVR